jgi:hypothetical protein
MWMPFDFLAPWLWLTLAAGCLMLSLLTLRELQGLLSTPVCLFLGRISFAVYLLHFVVLLLTDVYVMPYLGPATNAHGDDDRTVAAVICYLFIILPTTLGASYLFTIHVDDVAIELSRDFCSLWLARCPSHCGCLKASSKTATQLEASEGGGEEAAYSSVVESPLLSPQIANSSVDGKLTYIDSDSTNDTYKAGNNARALHLASVDWRSRRVVLLCILAVLLIPCCVPSHKTRTCFVDDDDDT